MSVRDNAGGGGKSELLYKNLPWTSTVNGDVEFALYSCTKVDYGLNYVELFKNNVSVYKFTTTSYSSNVQCLNKVVKISAKKGDVFTMKGGGTNTGNPATNYSQTGIAVFAE